jgi:hypothetical protein
MQDRTNDGPLRGHQRETWSSRQASPAGSRGVPEWRCRLVPATPVVVVVILTGGQTVLLERGHV